MIVQTTLLMTLLMQLSIEVPKDVSIGDRIIITVPENYEKYVWDIKRINLDGGVLRLGVVEEGSLKTNQLGNEVDFTTKLPGSYRIFVSAYGDDEIHQAIGMLNLDYDDKFVNRKSDLAYEPEIQESGLGDILDVGDAMPVDPNSIEDQILEWTKQIPDFNEMSRDVISKLFIDEAEKLRLGQVTHSVTLQNIYRRTKEVLPSSDFNNWRPWFQHINDLLQDFGVHGEIKDTKDWVPILRGIGQELRKVKE